MTRVIVAIILRETKTRFGKNKLGYLWAFMEPVAYIGLLLVVRNFLSTKVPFGENLYLFILTGILIYRLFISVASRGMNAISSNQALLTYPIVKPVDTVYARIILETLTMLVIVFIFFLFLTVLSNEIIIHYPYRFAAALAGTVLLATGFAMFNAVAVLLYPFWERFWGLIKFPLLISSGIFYIPSAMPLAAQDVLQWNPVLNCIEWLRSGTYLDYDPISSPSYVVFAGLCMWTLGLSMERLNRNKLVNG